MNTTISIATGTPGTESVTGIPLAMFEAPSSEASSRSALPSLASAVVSSDIGPALQTALRRRGFVEHNGRFHLGEIVFELAARWISLQQPVPGEVHNSTSGIGEPGLWKTVRLDGGETRVFEVPAWVFEDPAAEGLDDNVCDAYLDWALATANGALPRDWTAPPREAVESWLPAGALALQAGASLRQGELILAPNHWAVRFPILPRVQDDLPPVRHEWLEAIASQTSQQWRMIRVGFLAQDDGEALIAEVNLSGAPHSEPLFQAAVEGIRNLVLSAVQTAELVADVTLTLRSLELLSPNTKKPRKEK